MLVWCFEWVVIPLTRFIDWARGHGCYRCGYVEPLVNMQVGGYWFCDEHLIQGDGLLDGLRFEEEQA